MLYTSGHDTESGGGGQLSGRGGGTLYEWWGGGGGLQLPTPPPTPAVSAPGVGFVCEYRRCRCSPDLLRTNQRAVHFQLNQQLQVCDAIVIRACGVSHATVLNSARLQLIIKDFRNFNNSSAKIWGG